MPTFAGIDHVSLTVTDLDRSEAFYTDVLDFIRLADFGHVRILIHRATSFTIALSRHETAAGEPFTELNTGLDHLGLRADSRRTLEAWVERFDAAGVSYTPIQDMPLGQHLNFRDPDGIPLEFYVPSAFITEAYAELVTRQPSQEEIDSRLQQALAAATAPSAGDTS